MIVIYIRPRLDQLVRNWPKSVGGSQPAFNVDKLQTGWAKRIPSKSQPAAELG